MTAHERIGPTAYYTAYVWHRLGLPHAELFVTPTGAALYWMFRVAGEWPSLLSSSTPSMLRYLEYRHRLIDGHLLRLRPDLMVEIGAGLSRRGVTWASDHGVPVVELDLPAMIAAKQRLLSAAPPAVHDATAERMQLIGVDVLSPELPTLLGAIVEKSQRPAIVAEGLISYFDIEQRARLLRSIVAAFGSEGGTFLCDLHTKDAQARSRSTTRMLKLGIRTITRGQGAKAPFEDLADVREHFAAAGFDKTDILDARDYAAEVPQLRQASSPAHVVLAQVGAR